MQIVRPYRSSRGYAYGHFHGLRDSNTTLCGKDIGDGDWYIMPKNSEITCEKCIQKYNNREVDMVKEVEDLVGLPHDCWNHVDPTELIKAAHKVMCKPSNFQD